MSFLTNLFRNISLKRIFGSQDGSAEEEPQAVSALEKLQEAERHIQQKRAEEAAFLKISPHQNTDPHSFGYIPNPFRDTKRDSTGSSTSSS
jgi:hypothetical protein